MSWVKRVEAVLEVLRGSCIGEIELIEGDQEIIIKRNPGNTFVVQAHQKLDIHPAVPIGTSRNSSIDMKSPLTGVYYAGSSPTAAPFVNVGDIIQVGQTIALIEAMKVFSEVPSEVAGRIVAIKVQSGDVVKKGDVLIQVEAP